MCVVDSGRFERYSSVCLNCWDRWREKRKDDREMEMEGYYMGDLVGNKCWGNKYVS